MADERLRELERRYAKSGDMADGVPWLQAALQVGALDSARVALAASLGEPAARAVVAPSVTCPPLAFGPEVAAGSAALRAGGRVSERVYRDATRALETWRQPAAALPGLLPRVLLCAGRLVLPAWRRCFPDDPWGREQVARQERLVAAPEEPLAPPVVPDPAREELQSSSPYERLATLADRVSWAYKQGAELDVFLHRVLSCLAADLGPPHPSRARLEAIVTRSGVVAAAFALGPQELLEHLAREVAPWILGREDLPPRSLVETSPDEQREAIERGELRDRLMGRQVGVDVAVAAARCGDPVARAVLAEPRIAGLGDVHLRPLPPRLAAPPDPSRLRARGRGDRLLAGWTADCIEHLLESLPVGQDLAPHTAALLADLRDPRYRLSEEGRTLLGDLVRDHASEQSPRFLLGWALAHAQYAELGWARRDARRLRAALVREARGVPRACEPGGAPQVEAEAAAAADLEADWQLARLLAWEAAERAGGAPEPRRPHARLRLRVIDGAPDRRPFDLDPGRPYVIGRGSAADIPIRQPALSREHAALRCAPDGRWWLQDRSANGTFVGGVRVTQPITLVPYSPFVLAGGVVVVVDQEP